MIRAEGLTFTYRRGTPPVITDYSGEFPRGAVTALTGPSGSGKSTLLYLLALMLSPSQGRVRWDDQDASSLRDGERSRLRAAHGGFVFQDALLDPARTVMDNILQASLYAGLPRHEASRRGTALLEQLGVGHRHDHRPGEISGGQAQRVALCRALVTSPTFVFGDEPTGNLDRESAHLVWQTLVERARAGATVVIATHDEELADTADQRVRL